MLHEMHKCLSNIPCNEFHFSVWELTCCTICEITAQDTGVYVYVCLEMVLRTDEGCQ